LLLLPVLLLRLIRSADEELPHFRRAAMARRGRIKVRNDLEELS
jgi:hypothetical protein